MGTSFYGGVQSAECPDVKSERMVNVHWKKVLKSLRSCVEPQIAEWKRNTKWIRGSLCPETQKVMLRKEAQCDHHPTSFQELVDSFLESRKQNVDEIQVSYNPGWTVIEK
jgi:hypothetical protein